MNLTITARGLGQTGRGGELRPGGGRGRGPQHATRNDVQYTTMTNEVTHTDYGEGEGED
jgi:hypothetical protein